MSLMDLQILRILQTQGMKQEGLCRHKTQDMKQEDLHRNSLLSQRYFVTLNY